MWCAGNVVGVGVRVATGVVMGVNIVVGRGVVVCVNANVVDRSVVLV